jgi:protein involved in polysaccharide export with SLBB domain
MRSSLRTIAVFVLSIACNLHAQPHEIPLNPGDRIGITIKGVPPSDAAEISKSYTLDDNGEIIVPHLQRIRAIGLTPSSLQYVIQQSYTDQQFFTSPLVTVATLPIDDPRLIYVSRGVVQPGPKPYKPGLTAYQAIMAAGGTYDNVRKVRIIRTNPDGTRQTIQLDLRGPNNKAALNFSLQPEDQVIVPE